MRYRLTAAFTLFALALSLVSFLGLDPDDIFFYMFSVPAWVIDTVFDIHYVNLYLVYLLTVASWAFFGYIGDYMLYRRAKSR